MPSPPIIAFKDWSPAELSFIKHDYAENETHFRATTCFVSMMLGFSLSCYVLNKDFHSLLMQRINKKQL
jgi:hypothetical protein